MKDIKSLLSDLNDKLIKSKHPQMDNSHFVSDGYVKNIVGRVLNLFCSSKYHYEIHVKIPGSEWLKWSESYSDLESAEDVYTSKETSRKDREYKIVKVTIIEEDVN